MFDYLFAGGLVLGFAVLVALLVASMLTAHTVRRGSALAARAARAAHYRARDHRVGLVDETTVTEERGEVA